MRNYKLYIASGIFVLVTVLKLLLPEMTQGVRSQMVSAIDWDMDYQAMLTNLGSAITSDTVEEAMARLRGKDPEPVAVLVTPSPTPSPTATPTPSPTPEPTPTPDPVPERVRQAVSAFLETQAEFSDYDLPTTVSYDYLEIPFEYSAPVAGYTSSGFGYRLHPVEDIVKFHYGTDYAVNSGTDILSFADGTVTEVNWDNGYGNYIRVSHDGGWSTLYAHCSQTFVQAGQSITKGEKIALAGATGEVTGPHLHFELLHDGLYTNPEFFF